MKLSVAGLAVFLALAVSTIRAQEIAGDWQGTLNTGVDELWLVLHVTKNADGTLHATIDSTDQGANGIPASKITLNDAKLHMDVDAVHGTYDGSVSSNGSVIKGTWMQGRALALDFTRSETPIKTEHKPGKPSAIDGAWLGTLDTGMNKLRIVFHFTNMEDGLTATLDSPDQGASGIPATAVTRSGESIKTTFKQIGGSFEGTLDKDRTAITGKWTQAGSTFPLTLKRTTNTSAIDANTGKLL